MSNKMIWEVPAEALAEIKEAQEVVFNLCVKHGVGMTCEIMVGECEDGYHVMESVTREKEGRISFTQFLATDFDGFVRSGRAGALGIVVNDMYELRTKRKSVVDVIMETLGTMRG